MVAEKEHRAGAGVGAQEQPEQMRTCLHLLPASIPARHPEHTALLREHLQAWEHVEPAI